MNQQSSATQEWLLDRAADLLIRSSYRSALTGAGLSRESGIPTYRGPEGLWTRNGEPPMDQYQRFRADPLAWWNARIEEEHSPGEFVAAIEAARPNAGHFALARLERLGVLQVTITQNIDNLHGLAGSERLLEIHGNRTRLRCIDCGHQWERDQVDTNLLPLACAGCGGLIKSDAVMFGEPIPSAVLDACTNAARRSDCMLVVGTSAVVYPAAELPLLALRRGGGLIEVNPEPTALTPRCSVSLAGPSAVVLPALVERVELRLGRSA